MPSVKGARRVLSECEQAHPIRSLVGKAVILPMGWAGTVEGRLARTNCTAAEFARGHGWKVGCLKKKKTIKFGRRLNSGAIGNYSAEGWL